MVMRPFLRRHLPFLPGIRSERVEQTSPGVANDDQPLTVLNIHIEYRGDVRAGLGGINSSAGWIWDQRRTRTQTTVGTATEDVEMGGVRGWPLRNDSLLRTDCRDNIIQEPRTSWSAHNKYSTQRP